jgi:glutamyl-tRNA synthetase
LHIGHAKAALLNDYFAHERYKGTMLLRFDDTNPSKEKEEYQDAIVEDLELMGIKPDKTSYTSDYFVELYDYCIRMIKEGNAYSDDTEHEIMKKERMDGIESKCRNRTVEENLAVFEEMKNATEVGLNSCIRAKISFSNPNKAMRDPVIYRCNVTPHHRTGTTWKMYPTYDFCCPIVDSMEGVTHALRTIEYRDRNPQYEWMLDALKLRKVHIWDFARMNFIRTLLSKRKLTKFVDSGLVWGWDDPRFPTVRGIRRRGMTIAALREFILKQGPSRNIVNLDWSLFWATNKKYIDPVSPRFTAILKKDSVPATIKGARLDAYSEDKPRHGKNADLGTKKVWYSPNILFDQEDAASFKEGEEITLMNWGNAIVTKISTSLLGLSSTVSSLELELHLQGDFKKTEKKVTWLSTAGQQLTPVELVDFDFLITKDKIEEGDDYTNFLTPNTEFRVDAVADENVASLKKDDVIQFERKGYYRLDTPAKDGKPAVFFCIPTGKTGK